MTNHSAGPKLVQLLYASRMSKGVGPKELADILNISRKNNEALELTGALCYSPRYFLQCLEGNREAVNDMYQRIVKDERNEQVTLLGYDLIEERTFGRWTMAYIRFDEVDRMILNKYGLDDKFNPFELTGEQALGMLYDTARERAAFLVAASRSTGTAGDDLA